MSQNKTAVGDGAFGMVKIILFSDLHVAPDGDFHQDSPLSRLRAAVDDVLSCHADAVAVVVMGDIAHQGDVASYQLAQLELSRLTMPFYLITGNHDRRDNMRQVFSGLPSGFMQQTFSTSAGDFVLTDSVREGEIAGGYCEQRGEWLRQVLRTAQHPVFICMHHSPLLLPLLQHADFVAEYFRDLENVVAEFPNKIRYFMFGHLHATVSGVWQGVPFSVLRSFGHQTFLTDSMPDDSEIYTVTGGTPHYGVLLADKERVILHHHGFLENIPVSRQTEV